MRPIYENAVIHLDVTNVCHLSCANCTRHVGHHRKPYFMDMETVERGIVSLLDFPGRIGVMGGEPTLHPQFRDILATFRRMAPREKREFWTAGFRWDDYKDDILDTFDRDLIHYNDHTQTTGRHQSLLIAIEEAIPDPELRKILIDNCPYQARWSASITPKGGFFCEIAASLDWLMDGPGGYPIEPGWWDRTPDRFQDQVERYCNKCSGAIPMASEPDGRGGRDGPTVDTVSPGNLERLRAAGSPKVARGGFRVRGEPFTLEEIEAAKPGWKPRQFRDFVAHAPEDVKNHLTAAE
jgi:hypothetical protein